MPILATAIGIGATALPKLFQGAQKLFSGAKGLVKGVGKKIGSIFGGGKKRQAQNDANMAQMKEEIQRKFGDLKKDPNRAKDKINQYKMENEQITNSSDNTEKSFLGLQTVQEGKKQQTKIMMIAGGILLLLFFFMKKK